VKLQRFDFERFMILLRWVRKKKAFVFEKEALRFRKRRPSFCKKKGIFLHMVRGSKESAAAYYAVYAAAGAKRTLLFGKQKLCILESKIFPLQGQMLEKWFSVWTSRTEAAGTTRRLARERL